MSETHWGNCAKRHDGECDCGYPANPVTDIEVEAGARALDPDAFSDPLVGYGEGAARQSREQARLAARDVLEAARDAVDIAASVAGDTPYDALAAKPVTVEWEYAVHCANTGREFGRYATKEEAKNACHMRGDRAVRRVKASEPGPWAEVS